MSKRMKTEKTDMTPSIEPIVTKRPWFQHAVNVVLLSAFLFSIFVAGWAAKQHFTPPPTPAMEGKVWIEFRDIQHALDSAALLQSRKPDSRINVCFGQAPKGKEWNTGNVFFYKHVSLHGANEYSGACESHWKQFDVLFEGKTFGGDNVLGNLYIHDNFIRGTWKTGDIVKFRDSPPKEKP